MRAREATGDHEAEQPRDQQQQRIHEDPDNRERDDEHEPKRCLHPDPLQGPGRDRRAGDHDRHECQLHPPHEEHEHNRVRAPARGYVRDSELHRGHELAPQRVYAPDPEDEGQRGRVRVHGRGHSHGRARDKILGGARADVLDLNHECAVDEAPGHDQDAVRDHEVGPTHEQKREHARRRGREHEEERGRGDGPEQDHPVVERRDELD